MGNIKEYAMKTFGIELPSIGLTIDEEVELFRIRNYKYKVVKQDFADKSGKSWEIDEELSKQCLSHGWN